MHSAKIMDSNYSERTADSYRVLGSYDIQIVKLTMYKIFVLCYLEDVLDCQKTVLMLISASLVSSYCGYLIACDV